MTKTTRNQLGNRVRAACAKKGITQVQLCRRLRFHLNTLNSIVRKRHFGKTGAKLLKELARMEAGP